MSKIYSESIEDYVKTIYKLQQEADKVTTTSLAEQLNITPASATGMIKKLADMGLIVHQPYRGVMLTETGRATALEVIRHHRLIECFLVEKLGVPWDEVHTHAETWEHALSETLEARLDAVLNYPTTDPHGAPIPTSNGDIDCPDMVQLTSLQPGQSATIAQVSDDDPNLLRYLGGLGFFPGVEVSLVAVAPLDGPITICLETVEYIIGRQVANQVFVTDLGHQNK